jgi:hypothetical protein
VDGRRRYHFVVLFADFLSSQLVHPVVAGGVGGVVGHEAGDDEGHDVYVCWWLCVDGSVCVC